MPRGKAEFSTMDEIKTGNERSDVPHNLKVDAPQIANMNKGRKVATLDDLDPVTKINKGFEDIETKGIGKNIAVGAGGLAVGAGAGYGVGEHKSKKKTGKDKMGAYWEGANDAFELADETPGTGYANQGGSSILETPALDKLHGEKFPTFKKRHGINEETKLIKSRVAKSPQNLDDSLVMKGTPGTAAAARASKWVKAKPVIEGAVEKDLVGGIVGGIKRGVKKVGQVLEGSPYHRQVPKQQSLLSDAPKGTVGGGEAAIKRNATSPSNPAQQDLFGTNPETMNVGKPKAKVDVPQGSPADSIPKKPAPEAAPTEGTPQKEGPNRMDRAINRAAKVGGIGAVGYVGGNALLGKPRHVVEAGLKEETVDKGMVRTGAAMIGTGFVGSDFANRLQDRRRKHEDSTSKKDLKE
jgi:hypothetical protein